MLIAVNYHYIRENFDYKYPSIFGIKPAQFEAQLIELSKLGSFISQEMILDHLDNSKKLPEKAFIITFDDGLKEQSELALPILHKLGIPAVFFINTVTLVEKCVMNVHKIHLVRSELNPQDIAQALYRGLEKLPIQFDKNIVKFKAIEHYKYDDAETAELKYIMNFIVPADMLDNIVGKLFDQNFDEKHFFDKLYMGTLEIKQLAKAGYIGSHGHDHLPIGTLNHTDKLKQVAQSKKSLQNITGIAPYSFSYPYGSFEACAGCEEVLEKQGFRFAFTMERAVNYDLSSPFLLSRFDNNDMPLGKAYKGIPENVFNNYGARAWRLRV